jgi:hypothetical protein
MSRWQAPIDLLVLLGLAIMPTTYSPFQKIEQTTGLESISKRRATWSLV